MSYQLFPYGDTCGQISDNFMPQKFTQRKYAIIIGGSKLNYERVFFDPQKCMFCSTFEGIDLEQKIRWNWKWIKSGVLHMIISVLNPFRKFNHLLKILLIYFHRKTYFCSKSNVQQVEQRWVSRLSCRLQHTDVDSKGIGLY